MKQTIEIEVPDGKKAVWKDGKVYFMDDTPKLPKTWKEYCAINPICKNEYYIGTNSEILLFCEGVRDNDLEMNLLATKEDAKAHLALIQLHRLRDCYRQGWIPKSGERSYNITRSKEGDLIIAPMFAISNFLSFQTEELATEFLKNFKSLIKQAGDLI